MVQPKILSNYTVSEKRGENFYSPSRGAGTARIFGFPAIRLYDASTSGFALRRARMYCFNALRPTADLFVSSVGLYWTSLDR
jgi:hypothetical protein